MKTQYNARIIYLAQALHIIFRQMTTFIKISVAFVIGSPDPLINTYFTKIYQLKSLVPKNKGHKNFYERCDMTKKSISNLDQFIWSANLSKHSKNCKFEKSAANQRLILQYI